ncbi:MAG: DUF721 domain-containing protein [Nitrospirae bacterium]|nr:DUF721 domain-containing protein [Nitrospirota bacterium]MBI3352910.1 DUF721 domain-containing protein [Nitrospirota bacterium]
MAYLLPITSILKPLLKRYGLEAQMQVYTLIDQWETFVGPQIASHTLPYQLKFKKLFLYVDSSAWMNQLNYLKQELTDKINKVAGEPWVREIFFKIGSVEKNVETAVEEKTVSPQNDKTVSREELFLIEKYLSSLKEKELKDQLRKVFIQGILHSRKGH